MESSNFNTYYENIDDVFWRNLCIGQGELRHYEKGELFAEEGRIARYLGYIKSGTLKYAVTASDGSEKVVGLEFEGGFVADFPFSLYGRESRVSIVAVTPCDIYCIPTMELGRLMKSDERLYRMIAETAVALFDTTYTRYINLYTKSAQERYNELMAKHDDIFSLFPLKEIASFLNITPTYLSRLRKTTKTNLKNH
ncbi:MAG: Crp/Fnr family transcriptional regulator [Bacteroides sp.]|nr:Crp/Fnr family transcriptional regulator [Bacteroides sp.]